MNERDSEQVAKMLADRGYELTDDEDAADVVLLNTCSVRDQAEQKAIGKMGHLRSRAQKQGRNKIFGFLGCMAQNRGRELLDKLPDVDLVVGTQRFHAVAGHVEELLSGHGGKRILDIDHAEGSQSAIRDHRLRPGQVTAFVSIMQGCDMFCSFCIVPHSRGRERSRPIHEIVDEIKKLVDNGVREVTLLGQIVNLYGRHEFPTANGLSPFVQLLHAVHAVEGLERIRFTSPHPTGLKSDLANAFCDLPKLCEHMHLPAQSGSNKILRAMHRSYTREIYLNKVAALRTACPSMAITTDLIVGFPGETEDDFKETCSLVKEAVFDNSFIFRYSERKGTPAANLPGQLPEATREERNKILLELQNEITTGLHEKCVGTLQEVLVEGESKTNDERFYGRTRQNKIVVFGRDEKLRGRAVPIKIIRSTGFTLYGEAVHDATTEADKL